MKKLPLLPFAALLLPLTVLSASFSGTIQNDALTPAELISTLPAGVSFPETIGPGEQATYHIDLDQNKHFQVTYHTKGKFVAPYNTYDIIVSDAPVTDPLYYEWDHANSLDGLTTHNKHITIDTVEVDNMWNFPVASQSKGYLLEMFYGASYM